MYMHTHTKAYTRAHALSMNMHTHTNAYTRARMHLYVDVRFKNLHRDICNTLQHTALVFCAAKVIS